MGVHFYPKGVSPWCAG